MLSVVMQCVIDRVVRGEEGPLFFNFCEREAMSMLSCLVWHMKHSLLTE